MLLLNGSFMLIVAKSDHSIWQTWLMNILLKKKRVWKATLNVIIFKIVWHCCRHWPSWPGQSFVTWAHVYVLHCKWMHIIDPVSSILLNKMTARCSEKALQACARNVLATGHMLLILALIGTRYMHFMHAHYAHHKEWSAKGFRKSFYFQLILFCTSQLLYPDRDVQWAATECLSLVGQLYGGEYPDTMAETNMQCMAGALAQGDSKRQKIIMRFIKRMVSLTCSVFIWIYGTKLRDRIMEFYGRK